MQFRTRTIVMVATLALLAAACGGGGSVTVDPAAGGGTEPSDDVLSDCQPVSPEQDTTTVVAGDGPRPSVEAMEAAIADNPDAGFIVEDLQSQGHSREDALHEMYAQVVGNDLFAGLEGVSGYVTGAYASPLDGEPFRLSFAGDVPDEFDPERYELGSFGLEVTTGAGGFDPDAFSEAFDAAREIGIDVVSGSGDETDGTGTIEVIDATPEQVAAWEAAVDDPSRWCMVRATRTVDCDDDVVATAEVRAERQGEVLPNEQGDEPPTPERAEEVRRSYLGLTQAEAEAKAAEEGREIRVTTRDGVGLGATSDLQPGRVSLTVCQGVVVDTVMDMEPGR